MPVYHKTSDFRLSNRQKFEICVGAVLTQNTGWSNASNAITNLNRNNLCSAESIINPDNSDKIIESIKCSGYFNQKYRKLVFLSEFLMRNDFNTLNRLELYELRKKLLNIWGIGKETADSIILYVFNKPIFIVDAYTKRVLKNLEFLDNSENDYDNIRLKIENNLESSPELFADFHAVIVELCKDYCKKKPLCGSCPLSEKCES
jgi:endonuclease-3 related protein